MSGILVGFVVGAGWCDWFDNYLFLSAFIWYAESQSWSLRALTLNVLSLTRYILLLALILFLIVFPSARTLVAIVVSVKLTTDVPMGCIQILDPDVDEISQIRMVNG